MVHYQCLHYQEIAAIFWRPNLLPYDYLGFHSPAWKVRSWKVLHDQQLVGRQDGGRLRHWVGNQQDSGRRPSVPVRAKHFFPTFLYSLQSMPRFRFACLIRLHSFFWNPCVCIRALIKRLKTLAMLPKIRIITGQKKILSCTLGASCSF